MISFYSYNITYNRAFTQCKIVIGSLAHLYEMRTEIYPSELNKFKLYNYF